MVNAMAMPTMNDTDSRYRYPPAPPPKDINRTRIPSHQVGYIIFQISLHIDYHRTYGRNVSLFSALFLVAI